MMPLLLWLRPLLGGGSLLAGLLWLAAPPTQGLAQSNNQAVDSLQTLLANHPQADTTRVNLLLALSRLYEFDSKLLRQSATQALGLSRHLGLAAAQAEALLHLSQVCRLDSDFPRALAYAQQALKLPVLQRPVLKQNLGLRGRAFTLLSRIYTSQGKYSPALRYLLLGLQAAEQAGDHKEVARALLSFGNLYAELGDLPQALAYSLRSLRVNEQLGNKKGIVAALNNIGDVYRLMGNYPRAIHFLQQALLRAPDANNQLVEVIAQGNLADVYEKQGQYGKALTLGRQALAQAQATDDPEGVAAGAEILARAYLHTQQLDSARRYGLRALGVAQQTGLKAYSRDASGVLAQVYAHARDFPNAYRYQRLFTAYQDSLATEDTRNQASKLQFQYELDQKEARIALLTKDKTLQAETARRQRQLLLTFVVGLALVGLLALLLWRNNRTKQRAHTRLQAQKQQIDRQALHLLALNQELSAQNHQVAAQRDELGTTLTRLQATQTQLIQKEKMASLGELTAGIAHEIQNPLNFVTNFSEVSSELLAELADEQAHPERDLGLEADLVGDLQQNMTKITLHGRRAAGIVKSMLEHSQASAGERLPTDLNRLADEYLRLAYQGLRAKDKTFNAALTTDFQVDLPWVTAVGADVGRVLLNLLNNAFYAVRQRQRTGEPGYQPQVGVRTRRLAQQVQIQVTDNGLGMSEAVQQKIFQPFFTTKPAGEGTGLGLSLAHDIIAQGHGGSLSVESQPGQGTTLSIGLPLHEPA